MIPAVYEVAVATEFAIAARAGEKPDADPLTDGPTLDALTECIDASNNLVARDTRINDGEEPIDGA